MAINLTELIASRQKLSQRDKMEQSKERMSISELRKLIGVETEKEDDTDRQVELLSKIETHNVQNNSIQKDKVAQTEVLISDDEKSLTRLDGINTVLKKTLVENKKQTETLEQLGTFQKGQKISAEQIVEGERNQAETIKLLKTIAENTSDIGEPEQPTKAVKPELGLGITGIALALGGLVGSIKGYVEAISIMNKALFKGIEKTIVGILKFFPNVRKTIASIDAGISMHIDLFKDSFFNFVKKSMTVFDKVKDFVDGIASKVMNAEVVKKLTGIIKTVVGKVQIAFTTIKNFFEPIGSAFKTMQEISAPIANVMKTFSEGTANIVKFFEGIGSKLVVFKKLFGAISTVFSKIAVPITIIMSVYDTIMGAIKGYEEGGFLGGIAGAIKGLINSIVMAPLDLLKDIVSWVIGALGFDKVEQMLDSFSFEDIFSKFVDAIFSPIETLKKMFEGVVGMIKEIHIPEIGFTIPIIDKKVSIGPFYPFKDTKDSQTPGYSAQAPEKKVSAQTKYIEPTQIAYKDLNRPKSISDAEVKESKLALGTSALQQKPVQQENKVTQEPKELEYTTVDKSSTVKTTAEKQSRGTLGTPPVILQLAQQIPQQQEIKITQEPTVKREQSKEIINPKYQEAVNVYKEKGFNSSTTDMMAKRDLGIIPSASQPQSAVIEPTKTSIIDSGIVSSIAPVQQITSEPIKPVPMEANAVYNKSAENAKTAINNTNEISPVIVNAPVNTNNVNNSQNISMPKPTRNTDSGFNSYIRNNSVFI